MRVLPWYPAQTYGPLSPHPNLEEVFPKAPLQIDDPYQNVFLTLVCVDEKDLSDLALV